MNKVPRNGLRSVARKRWEDEQAAKKAEAERKRAEFAKSLAAK